MNEQDGILVIPDVRLKGWMFEEADRLMKEHGITQAVCLGEYGVLQVTGHTPVKEIYLTKGKELLFCDSFSTYQEGSPIGTQEFPVVTKDGKWEFSLKTR